MTGDIFDAVGNTHSIIVFKNTTARMEVKPLTEVTLQKANYTWISSPGQRLLVPTVVSLEKVVIFFV